MTDLPLIEHSVDFEITHNSAATSAAERAELMKEPGFGNYFTDHMVTIRWTEESGWETPQLKPYGPLTLDPAASVFHYAQEIFEGMKIYRHPDGSVWSFRPEANCARLARSAARLALPELPEDLFLAAIAELVKVDHEWVPTGGETSMYLRPFMIGTEPFLGVRGARQVDFIIIASPAGSYFAGGMKPVDIWLSEEYSRAGRGGTGAAKCGGNYASSLIAQKIAMENGCGQTCFLDSVSSTYIEELGGMNLFFVTQDNTIVTPAINGTILEGITRDSLITVARELGYTVEERPVAIDEWRTKVPSGEFVEVFACGTAAVITPVGDLVEADRRTKNANTELGKVGSQLREALLDIQYGRAKDTFGWTKRVF